MASIAVTRAPRVSAAGTLLEKAKRSKQTAFQRAQLRITEIAGEESLAGYVSNCTRPVTSILADIKHFSELIVDELFTVSELGCKIVNDRLVLTSGGTRLLEFTPAFFHSLARFTNTHTHMASLAGGFLDSLHRHHTAECVAVFDQLAKYVLARLSERYVTRAKAPKSIKLRMLKPDATGVWPGHWSARAMLHSEYRDDISHLWLIKQLVSVADTGHVSDNHFDGNLLTGALLIPEIRRVERDSEYGGGLYYFSGEVGNRRAGVMPFVFRTINRAVSVCSESWHVSHSAVTDVHKLGISLRTFVDVHIPTIDATLDKLIALRDIVFELKTDHALERLCLAVSAVFRHALSNRDVKLLALATTYERTGNVLTAFDIQNAMTRVARAVDDPVRRIVLNQLAGRLISIDWKSVGAAASAVTDTQLAKVFKEI